MTRWLRAPLGAYVIIRASEGFAKVAGGDSFGERLLERLAELSMQSRSPHLVSTGAAASRAKARDCRRCGDYGG